MDTMTLVTGTIATDHYRIELDNGRYTQIADEPAGSGGTDLGFSPTELLCSALAACTCATLRMYADRKQIPLRGVRAEVRFERAEDKSSTRLHRTVHLEGPLNDDQRDRLLIIAEHCFIHDVLTRPIEVETRLGAM